MTAATAGVPVLPDADEARRWARDELADEVYRAAEPGLVSRVLSWIVERLQGIDLPDAPGSRLVLVGLLLLLAVGVVVALALAGPVRLRRGRRGRSAEVFDDVARTARQYREDADRHAAAGRWDEAVRDRFRAVVRSLEERALLVATPGRTADEVAREAGVLLRAVEADLADGARIFDDVRYGGRTATPEHDARLRSLDTAVAAARPDLDRVAR